MTQPLLRQAGVYTASGLTVKVIPFLLLPVLTRYLTPTDYGIVAMFLFLVLIIEPFISLGLAGAVTVKYYDKSTDLPAYVGTGALTTVAIAIPYELLVVLLMIPLSTITQVPPEWLLLVVPLVVARTVGGVLFALLRVREKALVYGVVQNAQSAGIIALSLLFVVALGRQWQGRLEAELVAWFAFSAIGLIALWRAGWLRLAFVRPYARHAVRFGVPLIPHMIGSILIVQTDRLLLTNMVGVDETGLYTVGYQLALVIELVAISFNNAYTPWLYAKLANADDKVKRMLVKNTYIQFAAMTAFAVGVALLMPWLAGQLLDPSYAKSGVFAVWFSLGFLFSAMYYMVTNYVFFAQQTHYLAAVTFTVALINIPLTYVLIRLNGGVGAAQATAIALGLSFVFTWIVSQRVYPMPWLGGRTHRPPAAGGEG